MFIHRLLMALGCNRRRYQAPVASENTDGLWKFDGDLTNEVAGGPAATEEGAAYSFKTIGGYQGIRGTYGSSNYISVPCPFTDAEFDAGKSLTIEFWNAWTNDLGTEPVGYPFSTEPDGLPYSATNPMPCMIYANVNANYYNRAAWDDPASLWSNNFNSRATEVWSHLAWVWDADNPSGPTGHVFTDGNLEVSSQKGLNSLQEIVRLYFNSRVQVFRDLRISNIARYTANFTPETSLSVD